VSSFNTGPVWAGAARQAQLDPPEEPSVRWSARPLARTATLHALGKGAAPGQEINTSAALHISGLDSRQNTKPGLILPRRQSAKRQSGGLSPPHRSQMISRSHSGRPPSRLSLSLMGGGQSFAEMDRNERLRCFRTFPLFALNEEVRPKAAVCSRRDRPPLTLG
jgi:hypothetical protein